MKRDLARAAEDYGAVAAGGLRDTLRARLLGLALAAEAEAKSNATTAPRVRSGALRRSIQGAVSTDAAGATLALTAGEDGTSTGRYATLQEYGGTVRPTRSKYLAIPLGPARTPAGVSRYASPRDVAGLSWRPGREGGLLGKVVGRGKGARFEAWFTLRREVRVPETRFIGRAIDWTRGEVPRRLSGLLRVAVEGGNDAG